MKPTVSVKLRRFVGAMLMIAAALKLPLPAVAQNKVSILNTGAKPGHYWVWNGKPILGIGDSVTQGWMESGTNFNQTGYIDALASRGVNMAMIWSYIGTDGSTQGSDSRLGYDAPEIWPWQGSTEPNGTMNLGQFNQPYFDRLASFVSYAESKGILVLITVEDGWTKQRFGGHPFNSSHGGPLTANSQFVELANYNSEISSIDGSSTRQQKNQYYQERFADKLITTLEPYSNVVFEMFNEGEWYNQSNRQQHEAHFLKFFRDRTSALLMTNTDGISGDNPNTNPNVNSASLHPNPWTGNFIEYATTFNYSPAKSVFVSEPVPQYDGTNLTPATMRRSAWEAALGGAGWVAQNDTSFGWDSHAAIVSQAAARDELYALEGRVARFMNNSGVPFSNMAPNPTLSSTGMLMTYLGYEYLVYAPTGGTFTVNLSAGAGATRNVNWYDPRSGVTMSAGTIAVNGTKSFTAPDSNDWVLRVGASPYPTASQVTGWEFNTNGNHEGWTANANAHDQNINGGSWNLNPSGNDPTLVGPAINVSASLATLVAIGISSTDSNTVGQLYWTVQGGGGFSEARSQTFTLLGDGASHTYLFDLGGDPDWSGQITQLRLDPVATGNGGSVKIDFVRLLSTSSPAADGSQLPANVPEPSTASLLLGLALIGGVMRQRRFRSAVCGKRYLARSANHALAP